MSPNATNLQSLLFFDLVTVRETPDFTSLPEAVQQTLTKRFPETEYHEQGMFYPEVSKIIAITTGMFVSTPEGELTTKIHTITSPALLDEKPVIKNFFSLVERMKAKRKEDGLGDISLATFNGKRFDVPFLSKRALINSIAIPNWIQTQGKKPWEHPVLDIMECWDFGGRYDFTSLANMAYCFGIRDVKFTPYHVADNLYHNTADLVTGESTRPADLILAGSYNEVIATMRLAQKLIGNE